MNTFDKKDIPASERQKASLSNGADWLALCWFPFLLLSGILRGEPRGSTKTAQFLDGLEASTTFKLSLY